MSNSSISGNNEMMNWGILKTKHEIKYRQQSVVYFEKLFPTLKLLHTEQSLGFFSKLKKADYFKRQTISKKFLLEI